MKKCLRGLLILLSIYFPTRVCAQQPLVWALGEHAGIDFRSGSPQPISTNMSAWEGCASICDDKGDLLFYTQGTYVWDREHHLMPNGSGLTGIPYDFTYSSSQGSLIIPVIGSEHLYYIFGITHTECLERGYLTYSLVDMRLNNGLGDVVPGKKSILLDSNLTEHMGSLSGNGCNFWLVVVDYTKDVFKSYHIDQNGIAPNPILSPRITAYQPWYFKGHWGYISFAPNGLKMAMSQGNVVLYDFDPATGKITNPVLLAPDQNSYGLCFSEDNSKLYVSDGEIVQYDLALSDTVAMQQSRFLLKDSSWCALQKGQDQKIYSVHQGFASAIAAPNLKGAACNFMDGVVNFLPGSKANYGLPNYPTISPYRKISRFKTDTALCAGSLAITASDTSGTGYLWNDSSTNKYLRITQPGVYWVNYQVKYPCLATIFDYTDTITVLGPIGLVPLLTITSSCKGESNGSARCNLSNTGDGQIHYTWLNAQGDTLSMGNSLDKVPAGTYPLHISSPLCDTLLVVTIPEINPEVKFLTRPYHCQGTNIDIKNISDSYYTKFYWNFGDGLPDTAHTPDKIFPHAGQYKMQLIGQGAVCIDSFEQTIFVDSVLNNKWIAPKHHLCIGQSIQISTIVSSNDLLYLQWVMGDGSHFQSRKTALSYAFDKAGKMPVLLKTHFRACPDDIYLDTLIVAPLPQVYLGPDSALCIQGDALILRNLLPDTGTHAQYLWNTGDTTDKLKIKTPGHYSLTISSVSTGCVNISKVLVKKDCILAVPNAFTPNGDGTNDYFLPRKPAECDQFRMQIWNRWGQLVFDTRHRDGKGWDGTFQGKPAPAGVYIYKIEVSFRNGLQEKLAGNVTLIR